MRKIYFKDSILDIKVKDILKGTDLLVLFSGDKIYLQTQDGECCELEHHYNFDYDSKDPREAIIDCLYVGDKTPNKILKELEKNYILIL